MSDFPNLYTETLWAHPCCASHLLDLLAAAAYLINFEWHYDNTTPVNGLFSRDDFYCSVSHKWNNDKSKAVIGGVTLARKPSRKWELNSYWLTAGKECGSILSSRLWGGALRDDTKNGCVVEDWTDYLFGETDHFCYFAKCFTSHTNWKTQGI